MLEYHFKAAYADIGNLGNSEGPSGEE